MSSSETSDSTLAIVVPTLNEADNIVITLSRLQPMRARGARVIVVDGGSIDATRARASSMCDAVIDAPRGRASQLQAGISASSAQIVLMLHADSVPPEDADQHISRAFAAGANWGRFDVCIDGTHFMLPIIAWFMNRRSRLSGIATGDQGIFVTRALLERVNGVPAQALMEDIELCKRLRRIAPPACLTARIITSGRRWEKHGVLRTVVLMWRLRFAYWRGVDAAILHARYYGHGR
jgi:rSAM/selenodomain-associated transferase 2